MERCLRYSDLKNFMVCACLILAGRLFETSGALLVNESMPGREEGQNGRREWDVFTEFRAKLPAGRTDWRAFQLAFILYGGSRRRKFGGPLWKEKRAIMLCHRFWVFPGCSTKTDSYKFELVPARTACFWRNIYGLTLEARQACRGQSKQCRSVASTTLLLMPACKSTGWSQFRLQTPPHQVLKRTPMSAETTSSGDVDRVTHRRRSCQIPL